MAVAVGAGGNGVAVAAGGGGLVGGGLVGGGLVGGGLVGGTLVGVFVGGGMGVFVGGGVGDGMVKLGKPAARWLLCRGANAAVAARPANKIKVKMRRDIRLYLHLPVLYRNGAVFVHKLLKL